jgi:hypothetical protein
MSAPHPHHLRTLLLLLSTVTGCVGSGTSTTTSIDYGVGFYRPWGYNYGGWNSGYFVAPPRRGWGGPHGGWGGPRGGGRWVGPGRPLRSIPSQPRRGGVGPRR